jgi:hypothetical protein
MDLADGTVITGAARMGPAVERMLAAGGSPAGARGREPMPRPPASSPSGRRSHEQAAVTSFTRCPPL